MKRLFVALGFAVIAYVSAALLGYLLVNELSANTHDRELEAAMTAAFAIGPAAALVAFLVAVLRRRRP